MSSTQTILSWSFLAIVLGQFLLTFDITGSAFGAIFSDQEFSYKFDKSKLPKFFGVMLVLLVVFCIYGYLIAKKSGLALEFGVWTTVFASLGCALSICYVPRNSKNKNDTKAQSETKDKSWLV